MSEAFPDEPYIPQELDGQDIHARPNRDGAIAAATASAARTELHEKLDEAIDDLANPESAGKAVLTRWDTTMKLKDEEGIDRPTTVTNFGVRFLLNRDNVDPKWPVVQPAEFVNDYTPRRPSRRKRIRDHEVALILPDTQIAYRQYSDGTTDPFHDDEAMSVALQIAKDVKPDRVVMLGDYLDLPSQSKHAQEASFANTTQMAVDAGYGYLRALRELLPHAQIDLLEGNHDRRLQLFTERNAVAAFGLKTPGEEWPALSVPKLLGLDKLGVNYVSGWPGNRLPITDQLHCVHGNKAKSDGNTARLMANEFISQIFGHVHRIEQSATTRLTPDGPTQVFAYTPGTLSRIDGAVPSYHSSTDLNGRPIKRYENWQQGLAVVEYDKDSGEFDYNQIRIHTLAGYVTRYAGISYKPDQDIMPKIVRN